MTKLRLAALTVLLAAALADPAPAQDGQPPPVLVVSRTAVLERTRAAERLAELEREMTARLQAEVNAVKEALTAEEEELARLRATLPREEFDARVADFDLRVRRERRAAQSEAASLQQAFRDARRQLVEALDPLLEEVRMSMGASVIINSESVLAADPSIDITRRVIALFDERVAVPIVRIPQTDDHGPDGSGPDGSDPDGAGQDGPGQDGPGQDGPRQDGAGREGATGREE